MKKQKVQLVLPLYKDDPVGIAIKTYGKGPFWIVEIFKVSPVCKCKNAYKSMVGMHIHGIGDECHPHHQQLALVNVHGNILPGKWDGQFFEPAD